MTEILHKELSYKLVGLFFQAQEILGRYCRERQYGDFLEKLLKECNLNYEREFPIPVVEQKSNFADFLIEEKIILDLKAKPFITKEDYFQMKRYLEIANKELGLIVNFHQKYLQPRRVLNSKHNPA